MPVVVTDDPGKHEALREALFSYSGRGGGEIAVEDIEDVVVTGASIPFVLVEVGRACCLCEILLVQADVLVVNEDAVEAFDNEDMLAPEDANLRVRHDQPQLARYLQSDVLGYV